MKYASGWSKQMMLWQSSLVGGQSRRKATSWLRPGAERSESCFLPERVNKNYKHESEYYNNASHVVQLLLQVTYKCELNVLILSILESNL